MPASKKKLDFTDVKDASPFHPKRMPEGDYLAVIQDVEDAKSKQDNDMWVFTIKLVEYPRAVYPYYCTLDTKALFKIRHLFTAAGITIPRKMNLIDPNKVIGKQIGVALEDDEYDGNLKSTIVAVMVPDEMALNHNAPDPDDDLDEDDEELEEEQPKKKAPARRTRKPAPEPEEEDEEDEDEEEEPEPPRRTRKTRKPARPEPEDDDEEEEEDDEPEPPRRTRKPAGRTRASSTRKAPVKKRPEPEEDDEDEDEMDIDDL